MSDSTFLMEIGLRIMLRRKALHMTQEELAEALGVSISMISNLELGKKAIRPENLVKVCRVLNLSADFVLTGAQSTSPTATITEKLVHLTDEELQIVHSLVDYMSSRK